MIKTSTVLIAVGTKKCGFYRSVQEVPEPLRTQLITTTASRNSGTIVIADRAGKEQLTRVMARRDANPDAQSEQDRMPEVEAAEEAPTAATPYRLYGVSWMAWAGLVVVLALAAVISMLFGMRW